MLGIPPKSKHRDLVFGGAAIALASTALIVHARVFDFICDDAFITLRYSRSFAATGSPIYNVGERVEGFTSFLWMALTALGLKLGLSAETSVQILGALSGVLLMTSTWILWRRIEPRHTWVGIFPLFALAVAAPVAAWTLGGLETPLFAALVTLGIASAAKAAGRGGFARGGVAGLVLAAATLTRPEGAALAGLVGLVTLLFARRTRGGFQAVVGIVVGYLVVMGPFEWWRWRYYGYPLPNTFYVKTTGNAKELLDHGIQYIQLALRELGEPITQVLVAGMFFPAKIAHRIEGASPPRVRRAALWMMRLFTLTLIPYVAYIGGDFLDLYRFLVPLFPLILIGIAFAACRIVERFEAGRSRASAAVFVIAALGVPFTMRQMALGARSRQVSEQNRERQGIEPLGWSREWAQRWGATGRWIAAHADASDTMATGAAGAMPFFAGIYNTDVLGLCDEWVAHNGNILGSRPGHQREASESYMLGKRPVFLMFHDSIDIAATDESVKMPKHDKDWENKGYVWVVATVDVEHYGAPKKFFHTFLMRQDRAMQLIGAADLQTSLGLPE